MITIKPNTVFIIEDDQKIALPLARTLAEANYEPILLYTFEEAEEHIDYILEYDSGDVVAIIFDYTLDRETGKNAIPLVRKVAQCINYTGILYANSLSHEFNQHLREAGCRHVRQCRNKLLAGHRLIELLQNKGIDTDDDDY